MNDFFKLNDIADISIGPNYTFDEIYSNPNEGYQFINLKDISFEGEIDFHKSFITKSNISLYEKLNKGDILISRVGVKLKIALISEEPENPTYFSNNIIRIKLKVESGIKYNELFEYIKGTGKEDLYNLQKGTVKPTLTLQSLENLIIPAKIVKLTSEEIIIYDLKKIIDEIESCKDELNKIEISEKIRKVAIKIDFEKQIIDEFPFPIAYKYRQFYESQYNIYEGLTRLRDVFEATVYFLFNTILADTLKNNLLELINFKDKKSA